MPHVLFDVSHAAYSRMHIHADNCSPWAMESEQSAKIEESAEQVPELDMSQYTSLLKEEIAGCATCLSTNVRRFLWEDFKAEGKVSRIGELQSFRPKVVSHTVISPAPQSRFAQSHYIHNSSRLPKVGNFVKLHESICNLFFVEYLKYTVMDII